MDEVHSKKEEGINWNVNQLWFMLMMNPIRLRNTHRKSLQQNRKQKDWKETILGKTIFTRKWQERNGI